MAASDRVYDVVWKYSRVLIRGLFKNIAPLYSSVTVPKAIDRGMQLFIAAEMPLALLVITARAQTAVAVRISLSPLTVDLLYIWDIRQ